MTPLKLILHKYKNHTPDKANKKSKSTLFRLAKVLLDKGAEIEVEYLLDCVEIFVNIPSILEYLLHKLPLELIGDFPDTIRSHFSEKYVNMGFYDLMLEYSPSVILYMINHSEFHDFLSDYKDSTGQTVLHSAAKNFDPSIVECLMKLWYVHFIYKSNEKE